jgi:hypothetical protein
LRIEYTDDAISGSAYDDYVHWISVPSIVCADDYCVELQCGARQNKSLLIIAGFNHHDNDDNE